MHRSKSPFPKDRRQAARDFCETARIKAASVSLLAPEMSPATFLKELLDREHYTDAIRMLAHRLSRRQAIWWGCLCLEHDHGTDLTEIESAALTAATAWVIDPSDENRRVAGSAGKIAKTKTAAGALAKAVFWSGGSLSKPEYPCVPPPPDVCARGVASSILLLAANHRGHEFRQRRRKEFLDLGFQVEMGTLHWETPAAHAKEAVELACEHVEVSA